MELYFIDLKSYRRRYFSAVVLEALMVIGSYVAPRYFMPTIVPVLALSRATVNYLLIGLLFLAFGHVRIQKKRIAQLRGLSDFGQKSSQYEKLFAFRLGWYIFSCLVSGVLYVLTWRNLFFYFAIFDLVLMLPYYPNKVLIRKELQNDEIAFD